MKSVKPNELKSRKTAAKTSATAAVKKTVKAAAAKTAAAPTIVARREITRDLIAARAYTIWEQQGRPAGRDLENWLLAESQLQQELQPFTD